jgi:hypothetical protein
MVRSFLRNGRKPYRTSSSRERNDHFLRVVGCKQHRHERAPERARAASDQNRAIVEYASVILRSVYDVLEGGATGLSVFLMLSLNEAIQLSNALLAFVS